MNGDREQLGTALGLAAGVNAALFLAILWAMAILRGFFPHPATGALEPEPETTETLLTLTAEPELEPEAAKTLEPKPEPLKPLPPELKPERQYVNAIPGQESQAPDKKDSRFFSSQNMRAASELDASPDGREGMFTNRASLDRPRFDLRDTDFRDGKTAAPAMEMAMTVPTPDFPRNQPPGLNPAPQSQATEPKNPAADAPPAEKSPAPDEPKSEIAKNSQQQQQQQQQEQPDEEKEGGKTGTAPEPEKSADKPPERAPLAFRDDSSRNITAVPSPPKLAAARSSQAQPKPRSSPPRTDSPPPLTRIPDRVPNYNPGLTTARSLGKITNKGNSSVDADETAEGRYGKSIRSAIEKNWRPKLASLAGFANPGLVEVEFDIDAKGHISGVKLMNPGEANPVMQDCALTAIINAKLPPPPPELLDSLNETLSGGRMRRSFSFLTY